MRLGSRGLGIAAVREGRCGKVKGNIRNISMDYESPSQCGIIIIQ